MPDTKARKLDTDSVIGFGGRQMANARLANIELRKNTDTHRRRIDYPPPPATVCRRSSRDGIFGRLRQPINVFINVTLIIFVITIISIFQ
jgi:hypothetical protein